MNTIIFALTTIILIGLAVTQTIRLAKTRQTVWNAMCEPYMTWFTEERESGEKLRIERISSYELPRLFGYAPVLWVGNATDKVDVRVNFITGTIHYKWTTGSKKSEKLGHHYRSSILRDIDESLRSGKSSSSMINW